MEILCKLRYVKAMHIGSPDTSVIDVPTLAVGIRQYDVVIIIHEHPAVSDLGGHIPWICVGSQFIEG